MVQKCQHFTGPAHDVLDSRMACKHLEPVFATTISVTNHGTTDGGPGLCGHCTGPLQIAKKSWATKDSIHWPKVCATAAIHWGNVDMASTCVMYDLDTSDACTGAR